MGWLSRVLHLGVAFRLGAFFPSGLGGRQVCWSLWRVVSHSQGGVYPWACEDSHVDMPVDSMPGFWWGKECAGPDHLMLVPFSVEPHWQFLTALPLGQDLDCPRDGCPCGLLYSTGFIRFSVVLCRLWAATWISTVV